jgi:hypothetical protein
MQFSEPDSTIAQAYPRAAFHLPPGALAIQAPQSWEIPDAAPGRDRPDVGKVADNIEVHLAGILAVLRRLGAHVVLGQGRRVGERVAFHGTSSGAPSNGDLQLELLSVVDGPKWRDLVFDRSAVYL